MGTVLGNEADLTIRISKRHEIFPEEAHSLGRTIHFELMRVEHWKPVTSKHRPHGCAGTDPGEQLIVLSAQHRPLLRSAFTERIPHD
jgi:hypothetical protein